AAICGAVSVPVEVSGGMRSIERIAAAFEQGAGRVQLGSAAVRDPELVREAAAKFPGLIVVSIDARNGEVMTDGWTVGSGVPAIELAHTMVEAGVPRIMYTDISRDGSLSGPNLESLATMVRELTVP